MLTVFVRPDLSATPPICRPSHPSYVPPVPPVPNCPQAAQKRKFLDPLIADEISSCYSMTEPQGGADPKVFKTRAHQEGDTWVINGEKIWSSSAK